jgi:hypothetical protein
LGVLDEIERAVASGMNPANLRMEAREDNKWVEHSLDGPLDIDPENLTASR